MSCTGHALSMLSVWQGFVPVEKGHKDDAKFYKGLHEVADAAVPAVAKEFRAAIESVRAEGRLKEIEDALTSGSLLDVVLATKVLSLNKELTSFARVLQGVYENAAISAIDALPKNIKLDIRFDLFNPSAVDRLRDFGGTLITNITETTRLGVLEIVKNALERGGAIPVQARQIKRLIGLTIRQANAVENFRTMLISEGVKTVDVKRRTEAYYQRQLRFRATMIARTETITAANAGQRELWKQAAEQGLLDPISTRKQWVVTPDSRLCPICRPIPKMNPKGVSLDGTYKTPKGAMVGPTAHVMCRCAEKILKF